MSLFGAKGKPESLKEVLKRAKDNYEKRMTSKDEISDVSSSHLGRLLDEVTGPVTEGTATNDERDDLEQMERELHGDSEYERLRDEDKKEEFEAGWCYARVEDDLRRGEDSQATSRVETGQLPSDLNDM